MKEFDEQDFAKYHPVTLTAWEMTKEDIKSFISSVYDTALEAGLRETAIKLDEEFATFLAGDGSKFSDEIREQVKKQVREEIQSDINSVLNMLDGDTDRKKIANYIREYLVK